MLFCVQVCAQRARDMRLRSGNRRRDEAVSSDDHSSGSGSSDRSHALLRKVKPILFVNINILSIGVYSSMIFDALMTNSWLLFTSSALHCFTPSLPELFTDLLCSFNSNQSIDSIPCFCQMNYRLTRVMKPVFKPNARTELNILWVSAYDMQTIARIAFKLTTYANRQRFRLLLESNQ